MGKGCLIKRSSLAIALVILLMPAFVLAARYELIVNKSVDDDSLSKAELQSIFLGEKVKWDSRQYIKIALPEDVKVLKDFLLNIVGKTPSQFDNHWNRLVFTGKAAMPPSFPESARIVDYVASKPGSIGVIAAGQSRSSVKVISVK